MLNTHVCVVSTRIYGLIFINLSASIEQIVNFIVVYIGWLRGTAVERRSSAGEFSLSCARPVADG